ncbi:MAG TPA: tetratricopeptide repeat protein, partial [Gemmataceae bacterium]|nr:tetratricopeptide repeat protein [Gemmataceae bacterium]
EPLADRAAGLAPTEPGPRKELAGVLAALGRTKPALHLYDGLSLDLDDRYRLAVLHAADKDFAAAAEQCRAILQERPDDRKALRELADVLSWKKDYAESVALFERLTQTDPNDAELRRRLAEVLLWKSDYDQALARFEALLGANFEQPSLWPEYVDAAASARVLGEKQAALVRRIAGQVAAGDCKEVALLTRLAWLEYRLKDAATATAFLDRALALAPKEAAARRELAGVLAAAGRNKEALHLYEGVTPDAADHVRLAGLYAAEKDFAAAESHCRAALKEKPEDRAALRQLADVLSWKKDYATALPLLRRLAGEAPQDHELQVRLAEVTLWSGAAAQALPLFEKLTAADPNNTELQRRLAEAFLWSGDYVRALPRFEALLTANFDQPDLWGEYVDAAASARALNAKQAALARRVAERLPAADCKDAGQATRLAWVLYRVKEPPRAAAYLDRALALAPKEPAVRKDLAGVLAAAGRNKEALRLYDGLTLDATDHVRLAGLYAAEKDFATAEAHCRAALKVKPEDRAALRQLADVLSWKKDYAEALPLLRKLTAEAPEDRELQVRLAEVTLWSGAAGQALPLFEKLAAADPANPALQRRLAEALLWSDDYDRALPRLEALLAANFEQPELWREFVDAAASARALGEKQAALIRRIGERLPAADCKDAGQAT